MVPQPEQQARRTIDQVLAKAGWSVCDEAGANIRASRGVAIREFPLKSGHGFADYLLYVDGKAAGVIEAKKEGTTLTGVETQAAKYTQGLPDGLPRWNSPLPFSYQSTGIETRFTNGLDPAPRSRPVFAFHKPETLADWLESPFEKAADASPDYAQRGKTFLARLQHMPALKTEGLQLLDRVIGLTQIAPVLEAVGQCARQSQALINLAQQQNAPVSGERAAGKIGNYFS